MITKRPSSLIAIPGQLVSESGIVWYRENPVPVLSWIIKAFEESPQHEATNCAVGVIAKEVSLILEQSVKFRMFKNIVPALRKTFKPSDS